jgi:hypothetical protein
MIGVVRVDALVDGRRVACPPPPGGAVERRGWSFRRHGELLKEKLVPRGLKWERGRSS